MAIPALVTAAVKSGAIGAGFGLLAQAIADLFSSGRSPGPDHAERLQRAQEELVRPLVEHGMDEDEARQVVRQKTAELLLEEAAGGPDAAERYATAALTGAVGGGLLGAAAHAVPAALARLRLFGGNAATAKPPGARDNAPKSGADSSPAGGRGAVDADAPGAGASSADGAGVSSALAPQMATGVPWPPGGAFPAGWPLPARVAKPPPAAVAPAAAAPTPAGVMMRRPSLLPSADDAAIVPSVEVIPPRSAVWQRVTPQGLPPPPDVLGLPPPSSPPRLPPPTQRAGAASQQDELLTAMIKMQDGQPLSPREAELVRKAAEDPVMAVFMGLSDGDPGGFSEPLESFLTPPKSKAKPKAKPKAKRAPRKQPPQQPQP